MTGAWEGAKSGPWLSGMAGGAADAGVDPKILFLLLGFLQTDRDNVIRSGYLYDEYELEMNLLLVLEEAGVAGTYLMIDDLVVLIWEVTLLRHLQMVYLHCSACCACS